MFKRSFLTRRVFEDYSGQEHLTGTKFGIMFIFIRNTLMYLCLFVIVMLTIFCFILSELISLLRHVSHELLSVEVLPLIPNM